MQLLFANVMSKTLNLVNRWSAISHLYGLLMANEEKLQLGLQLPVRAAGSCANVVEELRSRIERLTPDLEEFACATTDRNGPAFVSLFRPVRSHDRARHHVPPVLEVVIQEPVQRH